MEFVLQSDFDWGNWLVWLRCASDLEMINVKKVLESVD